MGFQVHDGAGNLIAEGEGELRSRVEGSRLSLQIGGTVPPERPGLMFISAGWTFLHVDAERLIEARLTEAKGMGPSHLEILTSTGIRITLWPAMPPRQQGTEAHDATR